jgi:hypothetical protein
MGISPVAKVNYLQRSDQFAIGRSSISDGASIGFGQRLIDCTAPATVSGP